MDNDTMWVVTSEAIARRGSGGFKQLKVEELSVNVNLFLEQVGGILEKTPEKLGKFHFDEFEVYAEVTGKGTIALLGTGGEAGATGGLRFVFRRSSFSSNGK
jgi:hypothetical protein